MSMLPLPDTLTLVIAAFVALCAGFAFGRSA